MPRSLRTIHPLEAYLQPSTYLDFDHPAIQEVLDRFKGGAHSDVAQAAFHFVRDEIAHSTDISSRRVTRRASEVLLYREGICYAKSHLLASLVRAAGIPAGICYQKLRYGDTAEQGYCIHALNTIYLAAQNRWIRVDARGNKPGIAAEFSLAEERLAYCVQEELNEEDYLINYADPHPRIIETLESHQDCVLMCSPGSLPADLEAPGNVRTL